MAEKEAVEGPTASPSVLNVEIDIIVFTLLLNLGFLKITEISEFIGQIAQSINNSNFGFALVIFAAFACYLGYAGSILLGLYLAFKGRSTRHAMIAALVFFFFMYGGMVFNAVGHAQIGSANVQVPAVANKSDSSR